MKKSINTSFQNICILLGLFISLILVGCSDKRKVDYQLQEQCGEKSEIFFKKHFSSSKYQYHNHYNKKLNKCFVLVEEEEPTTMYLYDVNERKNYGTFRQIKDIIYCKVSEDNCESEDAWYKLVKPYMEE